MSTNQSHGSYFEDQVKMSEMYLGTAALVGQNHTVHDIPPLCPHVVDTNNANIPTSIKATKISINTICMADAVRLHKNMFETGLRITVGWHQQLKSDKVFSKVQEVVVPVHLAEMLWGKITLQELMGLRDSIKLKYFPVGTHEDARAFAEPRLNKLHEKCGLITLNPKIGRGHERRIQCSLQWSELCDMVTAKGGIVHTYTNNYGTLKLPHILFDSTARENAAAPKKPDNSSMDTKPWMSWGQPSQQQLNLFGAR